MQWDRTILVHGLSLGLLTVEFGSKLYSYRAEKIILCKLKQDKNFRDAKKQNPIEDFVAENWDWLGQAYDH